MKRVIGLIVAVLTILLISAPSYGNDWFLQVPSPDTLPKENTTPDPKAIPKTLPPGQNQSLGVFLKAPCGPISELTATVKKYREEMLFHGTGLTFSPQNQVYNGGMFFFTNQDTGSWTVLQIFPDGMACMIMNGKNFQPYTGEQPYGDKK